MMDDGQRYAVNEVMAEHVQGRCAMVPIVAGYKPAEWERGPQWFLSQSATDQQSILGKGRFDAWQAGKFELDKLVTVKRDGTWGDSLQVTSLRDLLAGRGGEPVVSPVQVQAKKAPVFKTTKEAEAWAKQNFDFIVDYGKLDKDVANNINQSILDNMQRVPQLKGQMSFVGSAQRRNKQVEDHFRASIDNDVRVANPLWDEKRIQKEVKLRLGIYTKRIGDVYASSYSGGGRTDAFKGIVVNEKYGKDIPAFIKSLEYGVNIGFHPIGGDTIKSVIDHELGHQIDKAFGLRTDRGMLEVIDKIKAMPGGITDSISRYASTNTAETIAEAWTEYTNNPTPRDASRLIGDYIMEKAKGTK